MHVSASASLNVLGWYQPGFYRYEIVANIKNRIGRKKKSVTDWPLGDAAVLVLASSFDVIFKGGVG